MSLTLTERNTLANDAEFINKVKIQAIDSAIKLSSTSTDSTVKEFCQLILKDPENAERNLQLAHGTAAEMDVSTINDVADSNIKVFLEGIFTAYAYATFNKIQEQA